MRARHLSLNTLPVQLHHFTETEDVVAHMRRVEDASQAPDSAGAAWITVDRETYQRHVAIWVDVAWHEKLDPEELWATLAHEAVHAAGQILDDLGQHYDGHSETLAYLVETIFRWLRAGHLEAAS